MQKYRYLNRSKCNRKLKFLITEKDFSEIILVKCPDCGPVNRVEIPAPAPQPKVAEGSDSQRTPSFEEFLRTFDNKTRSTRV